MGVYDSAQLVSFSSVRNMNSRCSKFNNSWIVVFATIMHWLFTVPTQNNSCTEYF